MKDWDESLKDARAAAKKTAKTPLISGILDLCSRDEVLPLALSDGAAARLLDIAILCGNQQAAVHLAQSYRLRPLRRWRGDDLWRREDLPVLSAALLAGADFQDLQVLRCKDVVAFVEIPLLMHAALEFDSEHWQQLGQFLTKSWPSCGVELPIDKLFLGDSNEDEDGWVHHSVSMAKVQNALRAGWDLKYIWTDLSDEDERPASLLDLAILCGQAEVAKSLASAGVEPHEDSIDVLKRACHGETSALQVSGYFSLDLASVSECQSAASAAVLASLKASFKRETAAKAVAVYQALLDKFYPRDVPMPWLRELLLLSMERPKVLEHLAPWKARSLMTSPSPNVRTGDSPTVWGSQELNVPNSPVSTHGYMVLDYFETIL